MAGGIIASTLPESDSLPRFFALRTGPWGWKLLSGRAWTMVEHTAFWVGLIVGLTAFLIPEVLGHTATLTRSAGEANRAVSKASSIVRGTGSSNLLPSTSESGANGGGCGMRNAGSNDASKDDGGGTQRRQRAFSLRVSAGWNAAQ